MNAGAPALLQALDTSGLGQGIRASLWIYPAANVLHVVGVTAFVSAVVVMDLALAGRLGGTDRARLARAAQRVAFALFAVVVASGLVLFAAEASHLALNRVFQIKMLLIAAALLNALVIGRTAFARAERGEAAGPGVSIALSLALWFLVVAAGRLIAYY
jgi:cytochrome bd-type quinol oxidase subunit 2